LQLEDRIAQDSLKTTVARCAKLWVSLLMMWLMMRSLLTMMMMMKSCRRSQYDVSTSLICAGSTYVSRTDHATVHQGDWLAAWLWLIVANNASISFARPVKVTWRCTRY